MNVQNCLLFQFLGWKPECQWHQGLIPFPLNYQVIPRISIWAITTVMHFSRPPNSNLNKDRKDIHRVAIPIITTVGLLLMPILITPIFTTISRGMFLFFISPWPSRPPAKAPRSWNYRPRSATWPLLRLRSIVRPCCPSEHLWGWCQCLDNCKHGNWSSNKWGVNKEKCDLTKKVGLWLGIYRRFVTTTGDWSINELSLLEHVWT